ncbi:hypothetical protein ACFFMM_26205 [Micromonospora chaiyaphumensis]|uniref:IPT/TIG domain-containing protein n=1 Tax=Micromonospora chaiyaphumensis TaxID=307119 RepID=A0A1C4UCQ6_9ACTN|nr:hypothetical protein [Micromonospora chaiyaphumensis]SCE69480.1 hypothetical protein GA0070214_101564 [Micromonospora chaiyaphumensis]
MRLSRIFMALTVGLAVAAVPTAAGAAQPQPPVYPPANPTLTVSPPTIRLGGTFTIRGEGFLAGAVAISVAISGNPNAAPAQGSVRSDGSTVAMAAVAYQQPQPAPTAFSVTADEDGEFTITYRPTRTGRHTFTATQADRVDSATGIVLPARPDRPGRPGGGNLPVTGDSLSTPVKLGGGLAGAGAVLVLLSLAWRRRGRFGIGSR